MAFINGHLHGQGKILCSLGRNNLGAGFCAVCGKGNDGQGIECKPKKILDRGGLHGKGSIHGDEYKAKLKSCLFSQDPSVGEIG
jgi:hypothetical protein